MSVIDRSIYLEKLWKHRWNGRVKIITGIRRCGKSFLLSNLFKAGLLEEGVEGSHIIEIALDRREHDALRNPNKLFDYVLSRISDRGRYYVFIDEIQLSYKVLRDDVVLSTIAPEDRELAYTTFYDVLNDLASRENLDVYVTGSNSRMLSSDIVTNFRDRGTEIRMAPLTFGEFHRFKGGEKSDDWNEYLIYGGMPVSTLEPNSAEREAYLSGLFEKVYKADVVERYGIENEYVLDMLMNALASSVGSLTNPTKLSNALNSEAHAGTTDATIKRYLDALEDAFLFSKAQRWDVKGKRYFNYPMKYYASDLGLRNARLNFRQIEETHLMENAIYNELVVRGYSVDVGAVRFAQTRGGKKIDAMHEIDFVVNRGGDKLYIQSAMSVDDPDKRKQEIAPLLKSGDFFRKVVVTGGNALPHVDENGITYVGVIPFLLDETIIG